MTSTVSRTGRAADALREFLRLEAAGGVLLMAATVAALILANTRAEGLYQRFLATPVHVQVGALVLAKPLILWVNDGLMAVFFFLVGLELKREVVEGELSTSAQIVLPALAAVGGMAAPAAVYWAFNQGDPLAARGWAIPAATDIAFALGVLALLGSRVPRGLKVFLMTLAVIDDLGAIVIIALFFTAGVSGTSLAVAAAALAVLTVLNRAGVRAIPAYVLAGGVLWVAVLKSGVHATLAGVALALFIPIEADAEGHSPLRRLEHDLHGVVAFVILPLFAFANAGVSLRGMSLASLLEPVPLGIDLGLLAGKTAGVFAMAALAVGSGLARMPEGATWASLLGTSVLCGVGFTMSLFIAGLAFGEGQPAHAVASVVGILVGSMASALAGLGILHAVLPRRAEAGAGPTRA